MRKSSILRILLLTAAGHWVFQGCSPTEEEIRSFYKTRLVCKMNTGIACGSRVKPLFTETDTLDEIRESWINRQGTVMAFVWKEGVSQEEKHDLLDPLFKKYEIEAEYVSDPEKKALLTESFFSNQVPSQKGKDKWYKGMEVDQLSHEEAGSISDSATSFALKAGLINEEEALKIKNEIAEYMKTELVKLRTYKELISDETDLKWKKQGYETYTKHIGAERAEDVRDYYIEYQKKLLRSSPDTLNIAADTSRHIPNSEK